MINSTFNDIQKIYLISLIILVVLYVINETTILVQFYLENRIGFIIDSIQTLVSLLAVYIIIYSLVKIKNLTRWDWLIFITAILRIVYLVIYSLTYSCDYNHASILICKSIFSLHN